MYLVRQTNPSAECCRVFESAIIRGNSMEVWTSTCLGFASSAFPPACRLVANPPCVLPSSNSGMFKHNSSAPSVFLRVSVLLFTKNLQQFLEGLLLTESLKSPISKMIPHGSPSASQKRLPTNVLSSLQIQFWQEATRVPFIKALHIILYAHSYCRHFWAAINLCDRNHSSFLQVTSSNCWVLFSIALLLSWSYPVMQTLLPHWHSSISSSCPGEFLSAGVKGNGELSYVAALPKWAFQSCSFQTEMKVWDLKMAWTNALCCVWPLKMKGRSWCSAESYRTVISRGRVNVFVKSTKLAMRRHLGHGAFLSVENRMLFGFAVSQVHHALRKTPKAEILFLIVLQMGFSSFFGFQDDTSFEQEDFPWTETSSTKEF